MISQTTITWIIVASLLVTISLATVIKVYMYHQQIDDDPDHKK